MSYSPTLQRFMEAEPYGAAYVDGANLYQAFGDNPITRVDPFGTIQRDGQGNITFKVTSPPHIFNPFGERGGDMVAQDVELQTDQNNTIKATMYLGKPLPSNNPQDPYKKDASGNLLFDANYTANPYKSKDGKTYPKRAFDCHGYTFTDGQFWINNDQVAAILRDDGWKETGDDHDITRPPPKGTLAIFYDAKGQIVHSAFFDHVQTTDEYGLALGAPQFAYTGKGGTQLNIDYPRNKDVATQGMPNGPFTVKFYSKK